VTVGAGRNAIFSKLPAVNILMAIFTLGGCGREIRRNELGLHIWRLVAIDAGCGLMRSHQWERSLRMIEAREFLPRLRRVASLTACGLSVGA